MGSLRVGHDWAISLSLSCTGEGNGNPLQCSCLENSKDGGALWAAVYGVTQSRTRLKRLSSSSSIKHWNCGICLLGSQQVSGALTNKSTALPGRCFQLAHQSQTHTHTHTRIHFPAWNHQEVYVFSLVPHDVLKIFRTLSIIQYHYFKKINF